MKKVIFLITSLLLWSSLCNSQTIPSQEKLKGIWRFVSPKKYGDTTFLNYMICSTNKLITITYWLDTKESYITSSPYSYYGFWDDASGIYPKRVADLKSSGNRVLFYDDLGVSHDSLGNLIKYTKSCFLTYSPEGDDESEMPSDYTPTKLYLNFRGNNPDVYERIKEIPLFVMESLLNNKRDWQKYRLFIGFKRIKNKAYIYSKLNQSTKMYLIKGDEVEVIDEKGDWLKIRYYGQKTIEGWIKKSDIE